MIWSLKFWGSLFTQNVVMPELQASWIVFHFSLLSLGLCCSLCPKWHTWPLLPDECIFLQLLNSCFHDLQHIYRKVYIFIKCFMHWPLNNLEAPTPAHLKTEYNLWLTQNLTTVSPCICGFNQPQIETVILIHSWETMIGNVKIPFFICGWLNLQMRKSTDPRGQLYLWKKKKFMCKWTHAVQTCVNQRSTGQCHLQSHASPDVPLSY